MRGRKCQDCGVKDCACPLCFQGWELTESGYLCDKHAADADTVLYKLATDPEAPEKFCGYLDPDTGARLSCVDVCRQVAERKTAAAYEQQLKGGGGGFDLIDSFSASGVVAVARAVNEKNRAKLSRFQIPGAVNACFKVINKSDERRTRGA